MAKKADQDGKTPKKAKKAKKPTPEQEAKAIQKSRARFRANNTFVRLREMDCFPEVHSLIIAGQPVAAVARYIQNVAGEYDDVEEKSLMSVLIRYRDSLPPGEILEVHDPSFVEKARDEMRDEMENIRALDRIVAIMELNTQMRAESVALSGIPDRTLHQECESAARVIKIRHEAAMDISLYGKSRDLGKLQVNPVIAQIHNQFGDVAVKVASNPELNSRVQSIFSRVAQAASLPSADSIGTVDAEADSCDS